jgi:type I restriction enzyme M protein
MANNEAPNNDLAYADTLWKSADTLRGQIDAAEYKHVVLGLLFLKYIIPVQRDAPKAARP